MKKTNKKGLTGFMIGVDSGKEAIMYATTVDKPGPRYMHYPTDPRSGYDIEYFRGLVSEKMVIHRRAGQNVITWEKIYERNEPLDLRNYNRAAYKYFNWDFNKYEEMLSGSTKQKTVTKAQAEKKRRKTVVSRGIKV